MITADTIISLGPCWPEDRVRAVVGNGMTPREIATCAHATLAERRWVLTQLAARTVAGHRALVLWAAGCAQDVAHLATDEGVARCAISTAVAWAQGCATVEDCADAARAAAAAADAARAAAAAAAAANAAHAAVVVVVVVAHGYAAAAADNAADAAAAAAAAAADRSLAERHLLDLAAALEAL